jgi:catechol 2,3-dioxygenase-like lactoylglutathione lyase family enzyme
MTAVETPSQTTEALSTPQPVVRTSGMHHVAYACKDIEATHHFYEDLMGFKLIHTEVESFPNGGYFRHVFYDTGDGSCIAFFDVHGVGEKPEWSSAISTGNGLPVWVNHIAFGATRETQDAARARMDAAGIKPLMDIDHGWCHSLYYLDPNGIMVEFCRDTPGVVPDPQSARSLFSATDRHAAEKTRH